jgi:hypothetical protein
MTETPNKSRLLEQIDRERAFWEQLLAEIGTERMLEPGATGDWTFKDVVAHLNGWRTVTLARLHAAQQGQAPAAPPWPADFDENDEDDVDRINEWIYQSNRDRSLQAVIDEYSDSFQHMRAAVTALSDQELTERGRFPWLEGHALGDVITSTFGHLHEEHEPVLRAWLDPDKQANA